MPELAAAYSIGFVSCLILTIVYIYLRRRRRQSSAAQTLQGNLRKAGLFWSDESDTVAPWSSEAEATEARQSQKSVTYTGLILSLLSWAGVFFLLIIMLSERFFARSRRERRIFAFALATTPDLTDAQVQTELASLDLKASH